MKILLATGIYPPDAGGPATYTDSMAQALLKAGHEVHVICYTDAASIDAVDDGGGFFVTRVSRHQSLRQRYREYEESAHKIAQQMDLVYLQGPVSEGYPGTRAAKRAGKPTVMKVVGDYAWEVYMQSGKFNKKEMLDGFITHRHWFNPKVFLLEYIERWTAKRAKQVIVPSKYLKKVVMAWGVPEERITVIYNAVEPLSVSTGADMTREKAREQLGVKESEHILFMLARCVPWKQADFIIRLLPKLSSNVHFVVGGDGPMLESWKMLAKSLGLQERVTFTGRLMRSKAADWYLAADLFLLPTGYEGFPHVVPEAASVGLHSYVSDQGGNPETREILGSDYVTVLPYLDEDAWLVALKKEWPIKAGFVPSDISFPIMVDKTVKVLEKAKL